MNFHIIRRNIEISSSSFWFVWSMHCAAVQLASHPVVERKMKGNIHRNWCFRKKSKRKEQKEEKFLLIKESVATVISVLLYYYYYSTSECFQQSRHVWISNLINLFLKVFLSFHLFSSFLFWPFLFSFFSPIKCGKLIQSKNRFPVHSSFSAAVKLLAVWLTRLSNC